MTIREAEVVDNNDPDKKGKVQVRIFPEMLNFEKSVLPWCSPYSQGSSFSKDTGTHFVLEVGSLIRVLIEDPFYKEIRYISDDYVEGLYFYDKANGLSAISELGTQTYPQPTFQIYKDGAIQFHNSETGESGTLYKNGGYFLHDKNGNIVFNAKNGKLKFNNTQGSLKDLLKDFQSILLNITTPLNFIDGKGMPCTYLMAGTDLPKAQQTLIKINTLLED